MGVLTTIPGSKYAAPAGLSVPAVSAFEKEIAAMPGLLHYIDPAKLDADGNGRCRLSGAPIVCYTPALVEKVTGAAYSGRPVLRFTGTSANLNIAAGTVTRSWSVLAIGSLDASRYAAGKANLLSTRNAAGYGMSFRSDDGNGMKLVPNMSVALSQDIAESLMPASNYPGMWAASYDDDAKTSAVWLNSDAPVAVASGYSSASIVGPEMSWNIGGDGGLTSDFAWVGDIAFMLIFDRALHNLNDRYFMQRLKALCTTQFSLG